MKLFRRLLLSLFPQDISASNINPASMFVSFISPKQFFSVINRKVVENYKLNLFDIGLDPFEVKIGFGDQPSINVKDIDFYYGYNATANINGWNFYAPGNLGTVVSLVNAVYVREVFEKYPYKYFSAYLVSVYLLTFVFTARIKVFPQSDKEQDYRWFVDLFFDFYKLSLRQYGVEIDQPTFNDIKSSLLKQIHLFFMLFYFYQRMNALFSSPNISEKEFYQWLFYDELKQSRKKVAVNDFVTHAQAYTKVPAFSDQDRDLLKLVFPADLQVRYLFHGPDVQLIAEKLINTIYDKEQLDSYVMSFLKDDKQFEAFINYIMDYRHFKESYFDGVKQLTSHKFRLKQDYETSQEIDKFMSSLGDGESLGKVQMPDQLRQESLLMERLVNFYVTFIGGLWVGRGDNFYMRLFRKPIIDTLLGNHEVNTLKQDALFFYGGLLYNYSKNVYYYKYAFDNVKAGNDKFNLPLKSSFKEVYSNMFILKLFDENFINTILQDINKKTIKLYVTNKEILKVFKNMLGSEVSRLMKADASEIVSRLYGNIGYFLQSISHFTETLQSTLTKQDIAHLKDNLYTLDLWMWIEGIQLLVDQDVDFNATYGDLSILGITAGMRETLFGFLLYYTYLQEEARTTDIEYRLQALKKIYVIEVLNLSENYYQSFNTMIESLVVRYHPILSLWIALDENKSYFKIGGGNWLKYIADKSEDAILEHLVGEDVIWFRGYVKTISYFNKRYLIPK